MIGNPDQFEREDKHAVGVMEMEHEKIFCRAMLAGGGRVAHDMMSEYLSKRGIEVVGQAPDVTEIEEMIQEVLQEDAIDVIILILFQRFFFTTLERVTQTLARIENPPKLMVVGEVSNRRQIYSALRGGAKAYVSAESTGEEFVKAISEVKQGKVYLSADAAELVVDDISHTTTDGGAQPRGPSHLSPREIQIIQLMSEGSSSKEIGKRLHISTKTVENHRYNIYRKCGVDSVASLLRFAIKSGIVVL